MDSSKKVCMNNPRQMCVIIDGGVTVLFFLVTSMINDKDGDSHHVFP